MPFQFVNLHFMIINVSASSDPAILGKGRFLQRGGRDPRC